jgi:hypothetical protein
VTARRGWKVAYVSLWAAFLLAAALNMLRVSGGFLTNHLADVTVPALLYVISRGLATGDRRSRVHPLRWVGRTPERAALSLFAASTATEISQRYWPNGLFPGRYDPWDIVAYGAGILVCYLLDRWSNGRTSRMPSGTQPIERGLR